MSIKLAVPDTSMITLKPRISVIGVGGGGGNAVNNMISKNLEGVDFIVANTDAQALANSKCNRKIQLGVETTRGLGAGACPEIGRDAAEEARAEIERELEGANMVFITAGMGGGTGSGAAPVVAKIAKQKGILTIGVITKPFQFEGRRRYQIAESAVNDFTSSVDSIIVIPNQNLFRIADKNTTLVDAFVMADNVLYAGVRSITDLMMMPGLINLDFADIKSIMEDKGKAIMGTGEADGENRAIRAAEQALSNPLLDDCNMKGARGVLINITGGMDITLFEIDEAANRIKEEVDEDANIIFGSSFDEGLNGKIRVSIVATGIEQEGLERHVSAIRQAPKSNYVAESFASESVINIDNLNDDNEEDKYSTKFSASISETEEVAEEDIKDFETTETAPDNFDFSIFSTPQFDDTEELVKENKIDEEIHLSSAITDIPAASSLFNSVINKVEENDADLQLENLLSSNNNSFTPKSSTRIVEEEPELFSHSPSFFSSPKEEPEKLIVSDEEEEYTPSLIERVTGFSIAKRNRKKREEEHPSSRENTSFSEEDRMNLDIPSFLRRK